MALLSSPPAGMPSGVVRGLGLIDDPEVTRARREKMAVLYGEVVDPAQGHRARAHGTAPPHGAEVDHVGGLMGAGGDGGGEGAGAGADPLDGSPTKWANKYGADSSLFRDAPPSRGWNSSTKVEEAPPPPTVAAPSEAHPDRHEFRASGPAGHQGGAAWVSAAKVDKSAEDAALRDTKGRPSGPLKPQFRSEKRNTQAVRGWNSSARVVRKDPCHPPPRSDYQAAVRKHVFRNETPKGWNTSARVARDPTERVSKLAAPKPPKATRKKRTGEAKIPKRQVYSNSDVDGSRSSNKKPSPTKTHRPTPAATPREEGGSGVNKPSEQVVLPAEQATGSSSSLATSATVTARLSREVRVSTEVSPPPGPEEESDEEQALEEHGHGLEGQEQEVEEQEVEEQAEQGQELEEQDEQGQEVEAQEEQEQEEQRQEWEEQEQEEPELEAQEEQGQEWEEQEVEEQEVEAQEEQELEPEEQEVGEQEQDAEERGVEERDVIDVDSELGLSQPATAEELPDTIDIAEGPEETDLIPVDSEDEMMPTSGSTGHMDAEAAMPRERSTNPFSAAGPPHNPAPSVPAGGASTAAVHTEEQQRVGVDASAEDVPPADDWVVVAALDDNAKAEAAQAEAAQAEAKAEAAGEKADAPPAAGGDAQATPAAADAPIMTRTLSSVTRQVVSNFGQGIDREAASGVVGDVIPEDIAEVFGVPDAAEADGALTDGSGFGTEDEVELGTGDEMGFGSEDEGGLPMGMDVAPPAVSSPLAPARTPAEHVEPAGPVASALPLGLLTVVGFSTCPFYKRAVATGRLLVGHAGVVQDMKEQGFETRNQYQDWLLSPAGRQRFADSSAQSHSTSPFCWLNDGLYVGTADDLAAFAARTTALTAKGEPVALADVEALLQGERRQQAAEAGAQPPPQDEAPVAEAALGAGAEAEAEAARDTDDRGGSGAEGTPGSKRKGLRARLGLKKGSKGSKAQGQDPEGDGSDTSQTASPGTDRKTGSKRRGFFGRKGKKSADATSGAPEGSSAAGEEEGVVPDATPQAPSTEAHGSPLAAATPSADGVEASPSTERKKSGFRSRFRRSNDKGNAQSPAPMETPPEKEAPPAVTAAIQESHDEQVPQPATGNSPAEEMDEAAIWAAEAALVSAMVDKNDPVAASPAASPAVSEASPASQRKKSKLRSVFGRKKNKDKDGGDTDSLRSLDAISVTSSQGGTPRTGRRSFLKRVADKVKRGKHASAQDEVDAVSP